MTAAFYDVFSVLYMQSRIIYPETNSTFVIYIGTPLLNRPAHTTFPSALFVMYILRLIAHLGIELITVCCAASLLLYQIIYLCLDGKKEELPLQQCIV